MNKMTKMEQNCLNILLMSMSKKKKIFICGWNGSFKGSHHAAIKNNSHCSSAPTAAFTIQMELSQKIRHKVIFCVCELDRRKTDCSKGSALTRCRDSKRLAQAPCLKLAFTAVVYLKTISGETHTWNTATILITYKRKPSQHYYSLTLHITALTPKYQMEH